MHGSVPVCWKLQTTESCVTWFEQKYVSGRLCQSVLSFVIELPPKDSSAWGIEHRVPVLKSPQASATPGQHSLLPADKCSVG